MLVEFFTDNLCMSLRILQHCLISAYISVFYLWSGIVTMLLMFKGILGFHVLEAASHLTAFSNIRLLSCGTTVVGEE